MSAPASSETRPIRVLIADDHPVVRQGTRMLLLDEAGFEVVGEAADGAEAVERAVELAADVVLMDLSMPGMDGVEAIRRLAERAPAVRVVLITGSEIDERTFAALEAGALGYLSKTAGRDEVLEALRRVARDEPSLPPEITRRLLSRLGATGSGGAGDLAEPLTGREEEVLALVAHGLTNRDVGARLHVSETTVRTHVSRILAKVGVKNRVQAALFALRHGIASLDDDEGDLGGGTGAGTAR